MGEHAQSGVVPDLIRTSLIVDIRFLALALDLTATSSTTAKRQLLRRYWADERADIVGVTGSLG
jgi:hypothetical protein